MKIFTIGHSNNDINEFIKLLRRHNIEILADVRSQPYSKYVPQFNKILLENALKNHQIKYLFMGAELGGRPDSKEYYTADGRADYKKLSESKLFISGLTRLLDIANRSIAAIMCSEENPDTCHRKLLIGWALQKKDIEVCHIRADCSVDPNINEQRLIFDDFSYSKKPIKKSQ
ncbi:MAG: DUF488 domain-containing protein [Planctomycetes bacterium]|nr:DUF488 domain-containing protein [Planctomycetota bacterium]